MVEIPYTLLHTIDIRRILYNVVKAIVYVTDVTQYFQSMVSGKQYINSSHKNAHMFSKARLNLTVSL